MTKQSDPVCTGLAEGLRPADEAADTFSGASLLDLLSQHGFWRMLHAAERSAEAAERQLRETKNLTDATERVASALETIAALFNAVIGVGTTQCYRDDGNSDSAFVPFIRSGSGTGLSAFPCPTSPAGGDDDDD